MSLARSRSAALLVAAAAVAVLVLVACASATGAGAAGTSAPSTSSARTVIDIRFSGGQITPPPSKIQVPIGTEVLIRVTSDVAEQVHNHYDNKEIDVAPGGTAVFAFTATQPGVYEVELHHANKVLMQLQVG